jgi:DNA-directed RNA polymerase specialized sigma subunit
MKHPEIAITRYGRDVLDEETRGVALETLLLRQLPLTVDVARGYSRRGIIEEQFLEAALVGLIRAVDTFNEPSLQAFARHAEALIDAELAEFMDDCRLRREDRIFRREQAAASAMMRIERALIHQEATHQLAALLGYETDELSSGFVSAFIRHPEILLSEDPDSSVALADQS